MEKYKCNICGKQYVNEYKLKCHMHHHKDGYYNPSVERQKNRSKLLQEEYYKNPTKCSQCSTPIDYKKAIKKRHYASRNKTSNVFCNSSCAATYNNTHKTHGSNRSKLECYLAGKLIELYPTLEFHFNKKDAINSELDIYIPRLSLAFELNGIYHYEPIHGTDVLAKIQNNDKRKFQACLEKQIELCIIDSSQLSYMKDSNALKYLKIIQNIIDQKVLTEKVDLESLPVVVYDTDVTDRFINKDKKIKCCKECNKEFIYKQSPAQVFCTKGCSDKYRRKYSKTYHRILQHKEEIKKGISEGLSLGTIAKNIGFSAYAGGYFYTLKEIVKEIVETKST